MKKSTPVKKHVRRKPTARPSLLAKAEPINPNFFYRMPEGWKFFGYKPTQLNEKIKSGVVPKPIILDGSADGRARGWFGSTIIKWQNDKMEAAA